MGLDSRLKRTSLRAPLKVRALSLVAGHLLPLKLINISEGGVLIERLATPLQSLELHLLFLLPIFPDFQAISEKMILSSKNDSYSSETMRLTVNLLNPNKDEDLRCEHLVLGDEEKQKIIIYLSVFARNLTYLLGLFEGAEKNDKQITVIRKIAEILGYDSKAPLPKIRAEILHDYQSVETL